MALVDLLIVLLIVGAGAFAFSRMRDANRKGDPAAAADSTDTQRMADEIRELRARIHVLERALTDTHASADLSSEIERLRDR